METTNPGIKILAAQWLAALKRNVKFICFTSLTMFALAAWYIMRIPNVYHAETRILVNPQRISDKYVSSAVSMGPTERLNTLSQQVLSTTRLETIFNELNLFSKERSHVTHQELIERMRHNIGIELKQSSDGPSSFTLSYEGESPTEVAAVTNRLAESFIAWNLHDREQEAQGTTDFLTSELVESKSKLDSLEQQLRVYKLQHLGELPDQLQANLQTLSRLEVQLQANVEARSNLDREAVLADFDQSTVHTPGVPRSPYSSRQTLASQIESTKQELNDLSRRYTPEHPDVVAKRHELQLLEEQLVKTPSALYNSQPAQETSSRSLDPRVRLIAQERSRLLATQKEIEAQISVHQSRVDAEPIREQEISQLLRDYETAKQHYALLLEKSYSAEMASELERKQQGGSFTLLDIARVPDAPVGPKRVALLVGAFFFSLFAGIGVGVLLEVSDDTIKSEVQLREALPGIPVLGVTPRLVVPPGTPLILTAKRINSRSQNVHIYPQP